MTEEEFYGLRVGDKVRITKDNETFHADRSGVGYVAHVEDVSNRSGEDRITWRWELSNTAHSGVFRRVAIEFGFAVVCRTCEELDCATFVSKKGTS